MLIQFWKLNNKSRRGTMFSFTNHFNVCSISSIYVQQNYQSSMTTLKLGPVAAKWLLCPRTDGQQHGNEFVKFVLLHTYLWCPYNDPFHPCYFTDFVDFGSGGTLVHAMACCLTAPSHNIKQHRLFINKVLRHLPKVIRLWKCSWHRIWNPTFIIKATSPPNDMFMEKSTKEDMYVYRLDVDISVSKLSFILQNIKAKLSGSSFSVAIRSSPVPL